MLLQKMCSSRLNIVVQELIDRGVIVSVDDLYVMSPCEIKETDMNSMTIDELYKLYLQWPKRHNERLVDGREQLTFYYEGRIVRELNRRTTTVLAEQLKVDYCNLTYANELENMSFVFSTPLICCDYKYVYSREAEHTRLNCFLLSGFIPIIAILLNVSYWSSMWMMLLIQ